MHKTKIFLSFICIVYCILTSWGYSHAESKSVFYTEPKGYPKSVSEGVRVANEYTAKKIKRCNKDNPLYVDRLFYDTMEDNEAISGTVFLNNLYEFDSPVLDKRLPAAIKAQAYTNNVMEKLLDKNAFSIIYGYPSTDRKGDEPRYLGRSVFGQRFSNIFFPPDSTSSTAYIEDKDWVKKPWRNESIYKQFGVTKDFLHDPKKLTDPNYQKRLEKLIIKGIEYRVNKVAEESKLHGYNNYFKSDNDRYKNMGDDLYWFNRVVITQPPTQYSWGLGTIYQKSGGSYWYMDIYIHPDTLMDLSTEVGLSDKYTFVVDENSSEEYVVIDDATVSAYIDTELNFGKDGDKNADIYLSDVLDFGVNFDTKAQNLTTGSDMDIVIQNGAGSIKSMTEAQKLNILQENRGIYSRTILKIPVKSLKQGNNEIKIKAHGRMEIKNGDIVSDTIEKIITLSYVRPVVAEYTLDYDEYTKEILHAYNKGNEVSATLSRPTDFIRWSGSTYIDFSKKDQDILGLVFGSVNLKDVPSGADSTSVSLHPKIEFRTGREFLGDNPPGAVYHPNGETAVKAFGQEYGGGISRGYVYKTMVPTAEGMTPMEAGGTKRAEFDSGAEILRIKAKVYNGVEMPLQNIAKGEESTGSALVKKLYWEGNRYEIPVQRYMKNVDAGGNIKSLTPADGKYKRIFQHKDTVQVTYGVNKSMAQHFAKDRKASKEGRTKSFDYAPFATDKVLQNLPYPLRSGYNYAPYGQYTATVRTEIYKKGGEQTEHQAIVNSVINSFKVNVELPTLNSKGQKVNTYPINVAKNTKLISDEVLKYNAGPSGVGDYGSANENALLGGTNDLFKKILEGWSYSGTQSSWLDKKYREYVKSADIHKITEETIITFTVNPKLEKFLTPIEIGGKNIPDGDYFIRVYFNGFENCHANKVVSSALNPQNSWSKKYNPNDPWNMVINIRGTRHDDMIY